jgi:hypothetical protein
MSVLVVLVIPDGVEYLLERETEPTGYGLRRRDQVRPLGRTNDILDASPVGLAPDAFAVLRWGVDEAGIKPEVHRAGTNSSLDVKTVYM